VRTILPAANMMRTVAATVSTTLSATCQTGGRSSSARRSSMRNGVGGGKSDAATAIMLCGARVTAGHISAGTRISIIAGVIRFCASFRSEQAEPMAMDYRSA
jgi:hypothetical protein